MGMEPSPEGVELGAVGSVMGSVGSSVSTAATLPTEIVTAIEGLEDFREDPDIYDLSVIVKPGDHVNKYTTSKDRLGQVIVKGDGYAACKEKLDCVLDRVRFVVK